MRVQRLAESAFLVSELPDDLPAYRLARELELLDDTGINEVVPAYNTLGVYLNEGAQLTESEVSQAVQAASQNTTWTEGKSHTIPACYELGEDLAECASLLGISAKELIAQHSRAEYICYAVGFVPGFPYLGYLPEPLQGVDRLPEPRVRLEPGSIGITGNQTGIYPVATPGGWRIVARTPLQIVDVQSHHFPIEAGDRVRLEPITPAEFNDKKGERL